MEALFQATFLPEHIPEEWDHPKGERDPWAWEREKNVRVGFGRITAAVTQMSARKIWRGEGARWKKRGESTRHNSKSLSCRCVQCMACRHFTIDQYSRRREDEKKTCDV